MILDVFWESLADSARMLPFLYLAYLLIETIERCQGEQIERILAGGGRWGFVPGALLGCVPQCGFSAIASNFYASKVITLGTLTAVFLATSDEALPLLFSHPEHWREMVLLIAVKIIAALGVGFLLDVPARGFLPKGLRGGYAGSAAQVDCQEEHEGEEEGSVWLAALHHTAEIFVFIFVFSFVIDLVMELVGEAQFAALLGGLGFAQPLLAALVGLVPNCAASVLLTQLYLDGALRFSSLLAGLCSGAGVGLAVLWRYNRSQKQNLFITLLLWACGAAVGLGLQLAALLL